MELGWGNLNHCLDNQDHSLYMYILSLHMVQCVIYIIKFQLLATIVVWVSILYINDNTPLCNHSFNDSFQHLLCLNSLNIICDWLWKNPPLTHKDKYLEISNSIIQSVISREGLKLHAYNLLQIYSYLIAIRLPTPQCTARCFSYCFSCHFRLFLSTPQALI